MNNFKDIEKYAIDFDVPIVQSEGLDILIDIITKEKPKKILEIGTAIGYSALKMNEVHDAEIYTFEREDKMYKEAIKNVSDFGKNDKIKLIFDDFLKYDISDFPNFDLIYIDGAKAQYYNFFKYIESKIHDKTVVVFDNLSFHDFVNNPEKLKDRSRNLKQLIRKIETFLEKIKEEKGYTFEYISEGDGIGILRKENNDNNNS